MCKSTDVSGSIAGYYYQILLACKELTANIDKIKEVGIETGADVRIVNYIGEKQSIEAKFHKLNMSIYDKDIIKTIYNFYRYSSKDSKLTLSTNVTLTQNNIVFFDKWKSDKLDANQKILYIKKCILRHCKSSVTPFDNNYEKYKNNINNNLKTAEREPYYIDELEKDIFGKNFKKAIYKKYAYIDENVDYNEFIKKLNFEFRNDNGKLDSISKLRKEIKANLQNICMQKGKNVENNDYEIIIDLIIDKFFGIIVENSSLEENPKFDDMKKFSTSELVNCINKYKEEKIRWICKEKIKDMIDQINEDEKIFDELINTNNSISKKEKLIQNHNLIKQELLRKITDEKFCQKFAKIYSLSSEKFSNDIIHKLIFHLTIISVYENRNIEDIDFLDVDNLIENISIKNFIKYMYKICPCEYKSISIDMKKLVQDFKQEYGDSYINKLNENLIVVFNGEFRSNNRPCEKKAKEVFNFLDNISLADKDMLYKNQIIYKSIDYRCDSCIFIDGSEEETLVGLNKFFNCKEEKDKNGVYKK